MLRRLFLSALFCLFLSVTANADSFVISSGQVNVSYNPALSPYPLFGFSLLSPGFEMFGAINSISSNVPAQRCPSYDRGSCIPGTPISLGGTTGTWGVTDFISGGAFRMNGVTYPVFAGNALTLTTGLFPIPFGDDLTVVMQTPFIMSFNLLGGTPQNFVSAQLSGGGIATLMLNRTGVDPLGNPTYRFQSLNYTFQTPEPASLFLLITGLGAMGYRLRRNR